MTKQGYRVLNTIIKSEIYNEFDALAAKYEMTKSAFLRYIVLAVLNGFKQIHVEKQQPNMNIIINMNIIKQEQKVIQKNVQNQLILQAAVEEFKREYEIWKNQYITETRNANYKSSLMFKKWKKKYLKLRRKGIADKELDKEFGIFEEVER